MDPGTGAGQVSARCWAMRASIWAATWASRIATHPITRLDELLPHKWSSAPA